MIALVVPKARVGLSHLEVDLESIRLVVRVENRPMKVNRKDSRPAGNTEAAVRASSNQVAILLASTLANKAGNGA